MREDGKGGRRRKRVEREDEDGNERYGKEDKRRFNKEK